MLQTAPPLPNSLCRDPAPLRSIWVMRDLSVALLWTHPSLRRDAPGERSYQSGNSFDMAHFSREQGYFRGLRGWKYWNDLCAEENSEGRRKYLQSPVQSSTARRRVNSRWYLHRVPLRDCDVNNVTNNDWNKKYGRETNHPAVRSCYNSVEPDCESFLEVCGTALL